MDHPDGLCFLGWLPAALTFPLARQELTNAAELLIPWGSVSGVITVFEAKSCEFELTSVSPTWWTQFFVGSDVHVRITAPLNLGYAAASEYARAMLGGSGYAATTNAYFLSARVQSEAHRVGKQFAQESEARFR